MTKNIPCTTFRPTLKQRASKTVKTLAGESI